MSIFLAAGLVNFVLDLWLVLPSGLNMGLAGAAWATLAAQYGAAISFLVILHRRGQLPEVRPAPPCTAR
jgi:Na+-driven multidrug efflux pump